MIYKSLKAKPARFFLTILSIVIGVVSVVIINSVSTAGTEVISDELNSLGIDCISITPGENFELCNDDLLLINNMKNVKKTHGILSQSGKLSVNEKSQNIIFWGLTDSDRRFLSVEMIHGDFLTDNDILNSLPVCVIGEETALRIFGKKEVLGEKVNACFGEKSIDLTIIGVSGKSNGILSEVISGFIPEIIYIPSRLLQALLKNESLTQISVTLNDMDSTNINNSILEIKRMLLNSHESGEVKVENLTENKNSIIKIINIIKTLLTAIAGISLIVACIGITNIMFIAVSERKREIGIKKAIGATNLQIGSEFLLEGILISVIGCSIGIIISIILTIFASRLLPQYNFTVSVDTIIISVITAIIFGSAFSIIPSIKAAKQEPVICLKNE